jgi:glutamine phosphoribosylpyrophosphate amidotransferase
MCGIAGIVSLEDRPVFEREIRAMCNAIRHRGPDDEGIYTSQGIGLGMRRLSIIDVSSGHQPVYNEDGTVCVVFNGEIYNFRELRRDLEARGHRFAPRPTPRQSFISTRNTARPVSSTFEGCSPSHSGMNANASSWWHAIAWVLNRSTS